MDDDDAQQDIEQEQTDDEDFASDDSFSDEATTPDFHDDHDAVNLCLVGELTGSSVGPDRREDSTAS